MYKRPKTVQEYLKSVPKAALPKLLELRRTIKAAAPKAIEKLSYGMPYYGHQGRLAYFRLAKNHIGLYIPTPTIDDHKKDVGKYRAAKATLHFSLTEKLPTKLIRLLIKARAKTNDKKK